MLLRKNKKIVVNRFNQGKINNIQTICPHIFDKSLEVADKQFGVFEMIRKNFDYCKMHEDAHKAEIFLLSMISAKSKKMFAITDVGLALTSPYALEKLGLALRTDKEEILKTEIIQEKEYLIMDRGFIDIEFISNLVRKDIKIIIPSKKNMNIYQTAKKEAIKNDKWRKHPNIKREGQEITLVTDLEGEWIPEKDKNKKPGKEKNKEIKFNACVIRIEKKNNKKIIEELIEDGNEEDDKNIYIVILSTDTEITESQIVRINVPYSNATVRI